MKRLLTALALATLMASPAFAQYQTESRSYMRVSPEAQPPGLAADDESGPYARYNGPEFGSVIDNGRVLGNDPDANVRLQLRRDSESIEGGSE